MKKDTILKRVNALNKYDLGHALKSHFDEENGYLIHRVVDERKNLATTFVGLKPETITNAVIGKLSSDEVLDSIYEWVNDYHLGGGATLKLCFNFKNEIGKGFFKAPWHNWNEGPAPCHKMAVVLKKTDDEALGFVIASVYPTVNQVDMDYIARRHEDFVSLKND